MSAKLGQIMKLAVHHGIAGQLSIDVKVLMASDLYDVGFVGTQYGSPGPIIMVMGQAQTVISHPERFGERFNEQWVRAFYDSDMVENHDFAHRDSLTPDCEFCGHSLTLHSNLAGCGSKGCYCTA